MKIIKESLLKEEEIPVENNFEQFIGKPLKDFLRTIDGRTKVNLSSEAGYSTGSQGDKVSGMGGLAHDIGWYIADTPIKKITVPSDKRFYDYNIIIECDQNMHESLLTEKNWDHQLTVGADLRAAIEAEDYEQIKRYLKQAFEEIHTIDPDTYTEDDLEWDLEDIEMLDTEASEFGDFEEDEDDLADQYDYYLEKLYELCDELSIWVPFEDPIEKDINDKLGSYDEVDESYEDDDYDDYELSNIYGGDMTYCPICGDKFEWDEDGDKYCPTCKESPYTLAQKRRHEGDK